LTPKNTWGEYLELREPGEHCIMRSSHFVKYNKCNLFRKDEMNRAYSRPAYEEVRKK
jgi:hypothetical protein